MSNYAKDIEKQNERLAKRYYDSILEATKRFGPQPIDPDTGEGAAKVPGADVVKLHSLIREDGDAFITALAEEAVRLDLSPGLLPEKWWREMVNTERRFQGMTTEPEDMELGNTG